MNKTHSTEFFVKPDTYSVHELVFFFLSVIPVLLIMKTIPLILFKGILGNALSFSSMRQGVSIEMTDHFIICDINYPMAEMKYTSI